MDVFLKLLQKDGNIVYSPVSISLSIDMIISKKGCIHRPLSPYTNYNDDTISIASRIYGDCNSLNRDPCICIDCIGDMFVLVDFDKNHKDIIDDINKWVSERTNNHIDTIIDNIGDNTKLLIVNAAYFKSSWEDEFIKEYTSIEKFWYNSMEFILVPMMSNKDIYSYGYIKDSDIKIIEIPYKDRRFSMFILLPRCIKTLCNIITIDKLAMWTSTMNLYEVDIKIPRFKVESSYELKDVIGCIDMAYYIREGTELNLPSGFRHKSVIEVNEDGTTASASTCCCVSDSVSNKEFYAYSPFIFYIKDNTTSHFLFVGKIICPM
ncbi:serpin-like protein [Swinepox virus]|uniref:Serpin-like protein n=1 Tax=Swinepox virus TaxID=10276 RepID=A0A881SYE5_SWPV|nr:serpin-like protein [Swinepox virus]